jgi:hypothetical protein
MHAFPASPEGGPGPVETANAEDQGIGSGGAREFWRLTKGRGEESGSLSETTPQRRFGSTATTAAGRTATMWPERFNEKEKWPQEAWVGWERKRNWSRG